MTTTTTFENTAEAEAILAQARAFLEEQRREAAAQVEVDEDFPHTGVLLSMIEAVGDADDQTPFGVDHEGDTEVYYVGTTRIAKDGPVFFTRLRQSLPNRDALLKAAKSHRRHQLVLAAHGATDKDWLFSYWNRQLNTPEKARAYPHNRWVSETVARVYEAVDERVEREAETWDVDAFLTRALSTDDPVMQACLGEKSPDTAHTLLAPHGHLVDMVESAPGPLWFWLLTTKGFEVGDAEPIDAALVTRTAKAMLSATGTLTPRAWRLFLRMGLKPVGELFGHPPHIAAQLLDALAEAGVAPDSPLLQNIDRLTPNHGYTRRTGWGSTAFRGTFDPTPVTAMLRAASAHVEGMSAADVDEFLAVDYIRVTDFLTATDLFTGVGLDRRQRTAPWSWWARLADEWHHEHPTTSGYQGSYTWDPVVPDDHDVLTGHGLVARHLGSSQDLAREGRRARHCSSSYTGTCASGRSRIYTIEDPEGSLVATTELRRSSSEWTVSQIQGPQIRWGNQDHPARQLANSIAEAHNTIWAELSLDERIEALRPERADD